MAPYTISLVHNKLDIIYYNILGTTYYTIFGTIDYAMLSIVFIKGLRS